jgi:membrane protein
MAIPGLRRISLRAFLGRVWQAAEAHAVTDSAAQLSYYALFSLFPFLFFLVTLTAWLPIGDAVLELVNRLAEVMPADALALVQQQLSSLLDRPRPRLLTVGLAVTLWSASRGTDSLRKALNLAYDVPESRSLWRTQATALLMTASLAVLVSSAIAMIVLGGEAGLWLAERADVAIEFQLVWSWLRWPVTALVFMLAVALCYYFLPDVEQEFRYITPGSVASTCLWLLGTWGFTQYAEHFGNYNVTYGSIGGVIVLLTWLYVSGLVLIVGGEVNAVLEHASAGGKAAGAREPGAPPPPRWQRPIAMPPAAVKSAGTPRPLAGEPGSRPGRPPPPAGGSPPETGAHHGH